MATITVSYDGQNLSLSDRGTTRATRNEQIIWTPGSGVHAVTSIVAKPTSPNPTSTFWSNPPSQNGVTFKGSISNTALGDWDYDICCNVGTQTAPVTKCLDPKIQVLGS